MMGGNKKKNGADDESNIPHNHVSTLFFFSILDHSFRVMSLLGTVQTTSNQYQSIHENIGFITIDADTDAKIIGTENTSPV